MILTYNGKEIQQREEDLFVNATQMCASNGKKVNDWLRLEQTKAYIKGISSVTGISATDLVKIKYGGIPENQGTWIHPRLAIELGRWISVDFAIWCDFHIKTLLETGKTELKQEPKRAITYYADRVMDIDKNLHKPKGTWCVIEKCGHILIKVERLGYQINKFDLLDGSVGIQWSNYRKGKVWATFVEKADYYLDDTRKTQKVNAYQYSELVYFSPWLETVYEHDSLPLYLKAKYSELVKI